MFKNRNIMLMLALGSLTTAYAEENNKLSESKYGNIYNKMIKNINKGKSNDSYYKLIEKTLNKRNKELKDLYVQSDYVMKPEFLEWQMFFSGFYNNSHRGGEKDGIREFTTREAKNVDLGMVVPVSGINRNKLDLNISPVNEPVINVNVSSVEAPQITTPDFTAVEIGFPQAPSINPPRGNVQNATQGKTIGSRTSSILYKTTGNTIFENLNVEPVNNDISLLLNGQTKGIEMAGEMSYENGAYTGTSSQAYTHTNYSDKFAVHNISNDGNYIIKGNWDIVSNNGNSGQNMGFISYKPFYVNTDGKVLFTGNLTLQQNNDNPSDFNSKSLIGMSLTLGTLTSKPAIKAIMENEGEIIIKHGTQLGQTSIAMQLERPTSNYLQEGELINSGDIIIESIANSGGSVAGIGIFVTVTPSSNSVLIKPGRILLNGRGNKGIEIGRDVYDNSQLVNSNIGIDGTNGLINLQGENNAGIYVLRALTSTGNTLADSIKNINILIDGKRSTGIARSSGYGNIERSLVLVINDTLFNSIEFGANSTGSPMVYTREGDIIIESSTANSLIPINAGAQNAIAIGERNTMIKNYMPINIGSGAQAMIGISTPGSFENYGDIKNDSSEYVDNSWVTRTYGGIGLALTGYVVQNDVNVDSIGLNKGNIEMNGDHSTGIYNVGLLLTSENDHITSTGNNAVGIYAGGSSSYINNTYQDVSSNTILTTDKLETTGDNSAVIYSKGGDVSLGSFTSGGITEVKADGKDTFAFFFQKFKYYSDGILGKLTLTSDVNASIKNGAIAFYYEGANFLEAVDIPDYLTSIVDTTNGNLNISTDQDSYNIAIKKAQVNLSDLAGLSGPSGITFNGSGRSKLFESKLIIDTDSNIDMNNTIGDKTYRKMEIGKSGVSISQGVTLSGTEDGLVGIEQSFKYNDTKIESSNSGTIDLSGADSIGIYNRRTKIVNNGLVSITGNKGIGLFSTAGNIDNNGEVKIGSNGIGIYSETYVDPSDNPYKNISIIINNDGKITAGIGEKAIGIFANENSDAGSNSYSRIYTGSNSDIDVSNSKGGIGIYSDKAIIASNSTTSGKISVGEDGVAIYAKDTTVYLDDVELNLKGDNSVGVYLENTNFYGTGTVNVDGTGIVVLNKVGTGSVVGGVPFYDQNFNVNSTAGSQYVLQNITNDTLFYDGTSTLGDGGTFVIGKNSAVLLGEDSNIVSTGSNMVGIALNGGHIGGVPVTINGEILNQEATNKGNIAFGDNSTGIYVTNGASGENQGTIGLGQNSIGLFGSGIGSSVANTNTISTGADSVGMYLKDGNNLFNTGNITGTGDRIIGLYLEGNTASTVSNNGIIDLSGDRSIGIYTEGTGLHTINNAGSIMVGDSSLESDLSIGVYNDNSNAIINNSGDISSGKTSIGIYNKGGQINQTSGTINVGEAGVGIYTDSGNLNLASGILNLNGANTVGIYALNNSSIDNNMLMNVSDNSFGVVLNSGSSLINKNISIIGDHGVFTYSDGGAFIRNELGADVTMTGSNSVGFYMTNGGDIINKASIIGNTGDSNIGIYNKDGSIDNSGDIKVGNSVIVDPQNPFLNGYAVGLYGEDVQSMKNTGNIEIGADAVGFYARGTQTEALNAGNITSSSDKAIGIYLEGSSIRNTGNITLSGDNSIGIAAARNSIVKNAGIITMNGNDSIGIYANANSKVINESNGRILINGNESTGVQLSGGSVLENYGVIEVSSGTIGSTQVVEGSTSYTPPSIINAGVIKVDEKFDLNGMNIVIKSDPVSFRAPTIEEITAGGYSPSDIDAGFLLSNNVSIKAPSFDFGDTPIGIDSSFTQGTNARVYKFENVFDPLTPEGGPNSGEIAVKSGSLTFDAIPVVNDSGKIDVWMEKINYDNFTNGAWYDDFARNIEGNYLNATGGALELYDKLDLITDVNDLKSDFSQLSGSMYANITQREQNIGEVFNNALDILQNSENNTKENVKVNIITGKGSTKEDTSGVESYDYNTYGVLALREVERTYRHKFGYSLGYTRTDFEMKDSKNKDQTDTIQLGLHNKYSVNGWSIKNDLLGRVSFHDVDRSVNWSGGTKSDLNSNYNVYGVSSLNELGKDLEISKNTKVTPYIGLELGYMMHPSFEEKGGAESLKVDRNDAYSLKPNIGIRLDGEKDFGATSKWKLKGNIGIGYEYELGNMNNQEKASLTSIEDAYHELAKTAEDKGRIKTSGYAGVELKETYGIYITGEYGIGQDKQEDYKLGLSLKAMF